MKIGALDRIADIQTRIGEIEERISGFSEIFQAELQKATTEATSETAAVAATKESSPVDYTILADLLRNNASLNNLFVDSTDTSNSTTRIGSTLQQALTGNTDVNTAIQTYLNNSDSSGTNSINNVLDIANAWGTSNSTNTLQQALTGNTNINTAIQAYLNNSNFSKTNSINNVLDIANILDTSTSTNALRQPLTGNADINAAIATYLKNNYYTGTGNVSNILGTTNQADTLNLSSIVKGLVGQTDDESKE